MRQKPSQTSRREVLRLGALSCMSFGLPHLLKANDEQRTSGLQGGTFGRAKRVIMLFLHGGHPQQETFDPKPQGPVDVRGAFGAISTSVVGVQFSELLPRTAKLMHKLAIIRSMAHQNPNHVQACLPAQTGHKHPPGIPGGDFPPSATDFPPFGAVHDHLRHAKNLPNWVRVGPLMTRGNGTVLHGQLAGLLGRAHESFVVDQKLTSKDVTVQATRPVGSLTDIRLKDRHRLRTEFNRIARKLDDFATERGINDYYEKAVQILTSRQARAAFDLSKEPDALREKYGWTEFGQRCLLARRLTEAGVPIVNVNYCHTPSGSWDTHSKNAEKMRKSLGPTLDQSLAALVQDLDQRGQLEETLLVVNAEFGRTPKINKNAGRDHWPFVYSLAFAGAGIKAGAVVGASDKSAAYPATRPYDPADVAATIYHLMGISSDTVIHDMSGRPHQLIIGRPVDGILV